MLRERCAVFIGIAGGGMRRVTGYDQCKSLLMAGVLISKSAVHKNTLTGPLRE